MKIRKPAYAFLLLIVLSALFAAGIGALRLDTIFRREQVRTEFKIEKIRQMLALIEKDYTTEYNRFLKRIESVTGLMGLMLPGFLENGKYTGPMVFNDGFVVQIKDDRIQYPAQLEFPPELNSDMFGDDVKITEVDPSLNFSMEDSYIISTANIGGPYYYVDFTQINELSDDIYDVVQLVDTVSDIEKYYNCRLLVLTSYERKGSVPDPNAEPEFFVIPAETVSENDPEGKKPAEMGISRKILTERPRSLVYNGKEYLSSFSDLSVMGFQGTVIILNDMNDYEYYAINTIVIITALLLIIAAGVIMWIHWVQLYVRDNKLNHQRLNLYHPETIRKRIASVILVGGIGIFLIAIFYQTLSNLNRESLADREALDAVMDRLDENTNNMSARQEVEEKWSAYIIKRIAEVMGYSPKFRTKEYLTKINEMLNAEYMMLFDQTGKEYASSNAVIGYSLTDEEFLNDFAGLLNGLGTLIGNPIMDDNSQKLVQIIGTPVFVSDNGTYDVLIMAEDVEASWLGGDERSIHVFLENTTPAGNLCIVVDKESGTVVYSSNANFLEKSIPGMSYTEGAPESSDFDTYTVDTVRYYGSYDTDEKYIVYYLTEESYVRGGSFLFAVVSGLGFGAVIFLVSFFMLSSYNEENYLEAAELTKGTHADGLDTLESLLTRNKLDKEEKLLERWKKLDPGQKTRIFFHVILVIIIILMAVTQLRLLRNPLTLGGDTAVRSPINFIIFGNWKRGFNLLGFSGVLLVILGFVLFVFFKNFMLSILCSVLDPKGETICRLSFSLLQYAVVIGGVYLILGFLGFNTTFQITSVGIVSLAISLGSQDIVADILAGIFIIFEGDFQVGDVVTIDGFTGIVQEIGVRSTKVLGLGDNIKIIGNRSVKNVLNLSKMNTWLTLEFKIPTSISLMKVEKIMEESMPVIGERIPEIINGPFYKGVWAVADWSKMLIQISCECTELNSRIVTRKLNREIIVLLEENGITL